MRFVIIAAVMTAWSAWLFSARVSVFETSDVGRLEVDEAAHPIDAPASGRIIAVHMSVGQSIKAGDLLVELDLDRQQLQMSEEQSRRDMLFPQTQSIREQISTEERNLDEISQAGLAAVQEARAKYREAQAAAAFAQQEAARLARLHAA